MDILLLNKNIRIYIITTGNTKLNKKIKLKVLIIIIQNTCKLFRTVSYMSKDYFFINCDSWTSSI